MVHLKDLIKQAAGTANNDTCQTGDPSWPYYQPNLHCKYYKMGEGGGPICRITLLREISDHLDKGSLSSSDTTTFWDPWPRSLTAPQFTQINLIDEINTTQSSLGPSEIRRCVQGLTTSGARELFKNCQQTISQHLVK